MLGVTVEKQVYYVISKQYSEYTIGWVDTNCNLATKQVNKQQIIGMIQSGNRIENIELENGDIKFKGKIDETRYESAINIFTCLCEIYDIDTPNKVKTYVVVDKKLNIRLLSKESISSLIVKHNAVSNYYSTDNGEIRRMPGQNVGEALFDYRKTKDIDIYRNMPRGELEELLRSKRFFEIYESNIYRAPSGIYISACWRNDIGALIWYDIDETSKQCKNIHLLLDCILSEDISSLVDNKGYNISTSGMIGHQHISIQGNGIIGQYNLVLNRCSSINKVWDMQGVDIRGYLDHICRVDYYENIRKLVTELNNKSQVKSPIMLLFPEISMISMYLTLNSSITDNRIGSSALKSITENWEKEFKMRLADEFSRLIKNKVQSQSDIKTILEKTHIDLDIQFDTSDNGQGRKKKRLMDIIVGRSKK